MNLSINRYRFNFSALQTIHLPHYTGSTWRGLMGHQLKRTVCVTREPDCKKCLLWRNCAYTYLFETPPAPDSAMMKKYPAAPHPYIIHPPRNQPRTLSSGQPFRVDISLIGKASQHLPYLIHAFSCAGESGIGKDRGRFKLSKVQQLQNTVWRDIYSPGNELEAYPDVYQQIPGQPTGTLRIHLQTPLRLRVKNRYLTPQTFEPHHLVAALLRRISSLCYFHQGKEIQADYSQLMQQAYAINRRNTELRWQDWTRYSSRQKQALKMGGITGQFDIDSRQLGPLWPWLYLGQHTHLGKGTVMGLGDYKIEPKTSV